MAETTVTVESTATEVPSTMEQLLEKHKEEQKKLTSIIIGLRKSAPKSDKRKKREIASKIADLEYDLKKKQEEEIRVFKAKEAGLDPDQAEEEFDDGISLDRLNELTLQDKKSDTTPEVKSIAPENKPKKVNKARQRIEKRNAEMERLRLEAEKEAENQVDMSTVETEALTKKIAPLNLRIKQITADGHW
ncbi:hypothetical protein BDF20DRAFT_703101 [Mycotypha africana]|uniref:uncharacterized protein n=1 Tax=Mycotypha africana TaxID=64632 RepID=UPI00230189A4|nr:uncharacterized protein BDF20DRAFT_703101 [Mycotypha africana]KAI8971859.1 hypothetical protein BDF20DRAFT_703101 [Mycotypha africana]